MEKTFLNGLFFLFFSKATSVYDHYMIMDRIIDGVVMVGYMYFNIAISM